MIVSIPANRELDMDTCVNITPTTAALPGHFCVWLVSPEARFLKSKFVWANWDVQELMDRAKEIETSHLLTWIIDGVAM